MIDLNIYNSLPYTSLRKVIGQVVVDLGSQDNRIVVLDAEVGNSTFTLDFQKSYPQRFIQNFIAEQNMVSIALGLSLRGKIPIFASFGAFLSRAFDQIRMSQYSKSNLKIIGTHAGVSIGEDGPSQMALEDIALFRTIFGSTVLYPSDAMSTYKLLSQMIGEHVGISYIRITRADLPMLYNSEEEFFIGGSKTLLSNPDDQITIIGAGVTLHESLKAAFELRKNDINVRIIDLYSVKPIDRLNIYKAIEQTKALLIVEDHYLEGGIFSAVCEATSSLMYKKPIFTLNVSKMPRSGQPQELLEYEEIDAKAIYNRTLKILEQLK
jgi:transketolase